MDSAKDIFSYRPYWAKRLTPAPFLPMSLEEMELLGWDSCDIILVTGDAYIDHPSFGMAVIGRVLEAQGFRVGIISQPDWQSADAFRALGKPNLFWGITAGNMDSMVNRYTADRRIRSDDAYTPGGIGGKRPDRSVIVYAQRAREAYPDVPLVIGGIEASLRRIAHYDYWAEKVRRCVLLDAKADLLVYGNAERAIVEIAHRLAARKPIDSITDLRGTAFVRKGIPEGWTEIDSTSLDVPGGRVIRAANPYEKTPGMETEALAQPVSFGAPKPPLDRDRCVVRLPAFEVVVDHREMYAHASRVMHLETNPGNARALVQSHGDREIWVTPPPIPLTMKEMDGVYELPYKRLQHPFYGTEKIPAYEMIRFSVTIQRGCFGGCTFCSITEHEGRIIQNRSQESVVRELEQMKSVPGWTGQVSDLGGPTANMYRIACKDPKIESACRRPSCVFPGVCENLNTNHQPLIDLYRKARAVPGVKKVSIASGVRYDLAVKSPAYIKELAAHHTGGYLKIAPEHTEEGPLSKMMKPGIDTYERFKELFDKASKEAGKEQYVIPYFIAAHPGTTDQDMLQLALWLKKNKFRADQVQAFLPTPMTPAAAMYHTGLNPLKREGKTFEEVFIPKSMGQRRLHKAFLRYHDATNWPLLREALKRMGRADLIGPGKQCLIPSWQPQGTEPGAAPAGKSFRTQHTRGVLPSHPPKNPKLRR